MIVLPLIQQFCPDFPFQLQERLGGGADGETYSLDQHKVIKLSVIYENDHRELTSYPIIQNSLLYLINYQPVGFARVYEQQKLGLFHKNQQYFILYYYVMEKLEPLSFDEMRVFDTILSHQDTSNQKKYSIPQIRGILTDLSYYYSFNKQQVILFLEQLQNSKIQHNDLITRNILTNGNQFKLVDLDRITITEGNTNEKN